jgi:SAM-dependent methyltransferase
MAGGRVLLRLPILIVLGSWSLFCAGVGWELYDVHGTMLGPMLMLGLGAAPWLLAHAIADRRAHWGPRLDAQMRRHTDAVDALPLRHNWLWVALAAGAGLYLELVLIRFHGSCFQLFAFFKNFSLLACFLGLGIGYALGGRRTLFTPLVLPLLAGQVVLLHALRYTGVEALLHNPITEHLALGLKQSRDWVHAGTVYGFLFFVFGLTALTFIPLGQLAARLMGRSPRLVAYSWNLVGSLAGILAFYALSLAWAPPAVWMGLGALALLPLVRSHLGTAAAAGLAMACVVGTGFRSGQFDLYSPYQILSVRLGPEAHPDVYVNHVYFQKIFKLDVPPGPGADERTRQAYAYYNLPYALKPAPQDVLVVGAGTGNDVAAAVRNGAGRVDAVEIDPAILAMGRQMHPERPYQQANVRPIVNDARAHLRHARQQYDLIVYGLLDSHTLLSGMSGVRLDSYIYTVEGFREARARLKEGGLICLTFTMIREGEGLGRKLFLMLEEAFDGRQPMVVRIGYDAGVSLVIGDEMDRAALSAALPPGLPDVTATAAAETTVVDKSTDDWPFFYMLARSYPVSYAIMVVALLAVAFVFVRRLVPAGGGGDPGGAGGGGAGGSGAGAGGAAAGGGGFSAPCFLLGAGFMLLETKAITELALFYGSTWVVVGVVIAAILVMAFLANLLLIRVGRINVALVYGLLLLSLGARLALDAFAPAAGVWTDRIVMTAVLTLPLFFAGLAFSSELKNAPSVGSALSSNLLGAMLGGCLEYNSMYFGYRSLYVLALVLYALAFVSSLVSRKSASSASALAHGAAGASAARAG